MRDQRFLVLCIAAAQGPGLFGQVELRPGRAGELVAARSKQQKQLEQRPKRPTDLIARLPEEPNFPIFERAVALDFRSWRLDPGYRVLVDNVFIGGPLEKC